MDGQDEGSDGSVQMMVQDEGSDGSVQMMVQEGSDGWFR